MARSVEGLAAAIEDVGTVTEARQLEASAAAIYWTAWSQSTLTSPRFSTRDQKRVPQGWAAYPSRRSFLGAGASNRRATHPTNALLNYCHTLARCEASLALRHLGLDPMLGLLHNDTAGRDSLACDVQEAIRPFVEMEILKLLSARSFQRADFLEYPSGEVLLGLSLRQELCAYLDDWATAVASYAEFVRASLVDAVRETSTSVSGLPDGAPLSGSRRREDAAAVSGGTRFAGASALPCRPLALESFRPSRGRTGPVPAVAARSRTLATPAATPASRPIPTRAPRSGVAGERS